MRVHDREPTSRTAAAGVRLEAVRFAVTDPESAAGFWAHLLGRSVVSEPTGIRLPGDETQVGLRFDRARVSRDAPARLHLHLTSRSVDDQRGLIDRALRLGGRHLDVGQPSDAGFVVLADPLGQAFCVIEPGNRFLAGTGLLGEVTCDGTPAVGRFWSAALDWPLVREEGEQTAIQSPLGGTKLSWDGWELGSAGSTADDGRRFDLVCADPTTERLRLVGLGATLAPSSPSPGDAELFTDPGGTTFTLRRANG